MKFNKITIFSTLLWLIFLIGPAQGQNVTVSPEKTLAPLRNPYRGWHTKWYDKKPYDTYASIVASSCFWDQVEPEEDKYDWDYIDKLWDRTGAKGKAVMINIYTDAGGKHRAPKWIYDKVKLVSKTHKGKKIYLTDYNDPYYIKHAIDFIKDFYEHYKGNKRIHSVNMGLLGTYGEWSKHPFRCPEEFCIDYDTKEKVLQGFLRDKTVGQIGARYPWEEILNEDRFRGKPISFNDGEFLPDSGHNQKFLDRIQNFYEFASVGGEVGTKLSDKQERLFFNSPRGIEMIEQGHYSNIKMGFGYSEDPKTKAGFDKMGRRFGYSYQFDSFTYANNQSNFVFKAKGKNTGVAPFYYPWEVQIGLLDKNNTEVFTQKLKVDPRRWKANSNFSIEETIKTGLKEGNYKIAIRMIYNGASSQPSSKWKELDPRNAYVVFANKMRVVPAEWTSENLLKGGWSIIGDIRLGNTPTPLPEASLSFESPSQNQNYKTNSDVYVKVLIPSSFNTSNIKLYVNNTFIRQENYVPYEWNAKNQNDVSLKDLKPGVYTLKAVAVNTIGEKIESTRTFTVGTQIEEIDVITASGCSEQKNYPYTNAYDSDKTSRWANSGSLSGACIEYNFAVTKIKEVRLKLYKGDSRTYPIRITSGKTVLFEGNTSKTKGYWTTKVNALPTDAIKITMTGKNSNGTSWFSILDTEIIGEKTGRKKYSVLSSEIQVLLYPNPATDQLKVRLSKLDLNPIAISIYTITGQRIQTYKTNRLETAIDISPLAPGIYFVRINNTPYTHQFIKN